MSRSTSANYLTPSFPKADSDGDAFLAEDVQQLAAAMDDHNHSAGKGARVQVVQQPMIWRGTWSASTAYVVNDGVTYTGSSYICVSNVGPSATPPDADVLHWQLLASVGAQGPQGNTGARGPQGATGPGAAAGPGPAALPSISFAGDPNTGIYNSAADWLFISTGGVARWG